MSRLAQAVLTVVVVYVAFVVLFDVVLDQVIPRSVLAMYMFFVVVGVLAVFTFEPDGAAELFAPVRALVEDPANRRVRNAVFLLLPPLVAGFTYLQLSGAAEPPAELRSIHPAPPRALEIYGQRFDLRVLENPFRRFEEEDPERFIELVNAGAAVYVANCHFCHGDKLDGRGPYAAGLNPLPLSFQDVGTIAQLQESYVFWRVVTGGRGLPEDAAPWNSSMPAWQEYLTEEEVWQVILYLYDYTGHRPRSWEE